MQLPICALIAWLTIIAFARVPKRLSALDIFFVYCVVLTITATSYTYFELNLHSVIVPRVDRAIGAAAISRLITVPLWIVLAVDALPTGKGQSPRWLSAIAIWAGLVIFDWGLSRFNVISYHHSFQWHLVGTAITYLVFIGIPWGFTWWFKKFDLEKVTPF